MKRPVLWILAAAGLLAITMIATAVAMWHHFSAEPAPAQPSRTITKEYLAAATDLETAIMSGDVATADKLVDTAANFDIALKGLDLPAGFRDQVMGGITPANQPPQVLCNTIKEGGTLHLLRVRVQNGQVHAVYRILPPQGGLNYLDWILQKESDGRVRGVDVYNASLGETASATLRRIIMTALAQAQPAATQRLAGIDRAYIDHEKEVNDLTQASVQRKWTDVITIYDALPESLRREKVLSILRLRALEHLGRTRTEEYRGAIEEFRQTFPGDPCLNINCLVDWAQSKDFAACYTAFDALEKWSGGDPFLLAYRASLIQEEDGPRANQEAERLSRQAIAAENDLILAHTVLLVALTRQQKFPEAVQALRELDAISKHLLDVDGHAVLKELAASAEYQLYKQARHAPGASIPSNSPTEKQSPSN